MAEEYQQEQQFNAENSTTPGAVAQPDATAEQMQQVASDPTSNLDSIQQLQERQAFETYVQNSGEKIPENFKDAGAWFDSLKEAQANYTRGQQEMAELKKQYSETNAANPNYQEPTPEQPTPVEDTAPNPELRIPNPEETAPVQEEAASVGITEDKWQEWGMEIAAKGDLSDETKNEIRQAGFTDRMIDDFLGAQKARMREAYGDASKVVGGKENLDKIFNWAANNLSYEEQVQINVGLSSPAYEVTLRGLNEMYKNNANQTAKANEPKTMANRQNVADTQTGYTEYKTKREFYADRNNPRFNTDQAFRHAVEERMMRTDFNKLAN
jgi:Sec-independent protein translocase protein TatA